MHHLQRLLPLAFFAFLRTESTPADEGMWVFDHLPLKTLKDRYQFEPSKSWIEHVQKSSIRFNYAGAGGGSASFISSTGLVLTNHHVASKGLSNISTPQKNYLQSGFYASKLEEEIPAPGLELNQLLEIRDVTSEVLAAVKPGMSDEAAFKAKRAIIGKIEKDAHAQSGLKAEVKTLYGGGQYALYQFKRYTDVRIVFAPEARIAFFGGDPDNFEYPRYDLDMAIFRAYEDGKPAKTKDFLAWSSSGSQEGELVFVSGNPGSTNRLATVRSVESMRDLKVPFVLEMYEKKEAALKAYADRGKDETQHQENEFFGVQNTLKGYRGRLEGLKDKAFFARKMKEEKQTKAALAVDAKLKDNLSAWDQITAAQKIYDANYIKYMMFEGGAALDSVYFTMARTLVRLPIEDAKPDADRLSEFHDSKRATLEFALYSNAPIYDDFETAKLQSSLEFMVKKLGANNPTVSKILKGKTPAQRAKDLVASTILKDIRTRKDVAKRGKVALETRGDEFILLATELDDESRELRRIMETQVQQVEEVAYAKIAKVQFELYGAERYPDATFSPRLAFGPMKGYKEKNDEIPYCTTMGGAYQHSEKHGAKDPYELPASWISAKPHLDLSTPLNFVSTADIIGGNSGSPVLNKEAELVGLIFDGNIESLALDFGYSDQVARAVAVDSRGMMEALKKIYKVSPLVAEIGH